MTTLGAEAPPLGATPRRDRNSELSRLVALLIELGPSLNQVAAQLGAHKETARYWYKHLLLDRGFSLKVVPNYRKLGLDRLILIASFTPSIRPHAWKIFASLHKQCYVKEVEQTAVGGRFIVHVAVPTELAESCADLFTQLQKMGLFSRLQIHRFGWVRTPPMMSDHYDFRKAVWTYDWRMQQKVPLVAVTDTERATYDKVDVLILRHLQEKPSRSLWQISDSLGIGYPKLVWHQRKHVRGQDLINAYALDWRSAVPDGKDGRSSREYFPVKVILTGADERKRIGLISLIQRLPYLWFEAWGTDCYFASLYVPPEAFNQFLSRLRDLEIDEPQLQWLLTNQSSARDYGVSYHLFDGQSKLWQLNKPHVIKKFEKLMVRVSSS